MEKQLLRSVRMGVVLVLLTPLIVSDHTLFPFIVGKAIYAHSIIEITFGIWVILALRYPSHRPTRSLLLLLFGIYLVVAILAGLLGVSPQRSLWSTYERMQGIVDLGHWFALTIVVTSAFKPLTSWRILLNVNLGVSLFMAMLGLAQHFEVAVGLLPSFITNTQLLHVTLGNTTYVGAYMLVNILVGFGFIAQWLQQRFTATRPRQPAQRRRRRAARPDNNLAPMIGRHSWFPAFWIMVILLDAWVMILTGTRGAVVGLVAGLIMAATIYALWGQRWAIRLVAISFVAAIVFVGVVFTLSKDTPFVERLSESSVLVRRFASIGPADLSVKGRLASLNTGIDGFIERPLLGWGPENYAIVFGRYFRGDPSIQESFDQAHNKLLEELTTKGLLGFAIYVTIWLYMLWIIIRYFRDDGRQDQIFVLFIGSALTGYFIQNLFLFDTPATLLQLILLLSLVACLENDVRRSAVGSRHPQSGTTGRSSAKIDGKRHTTTFGQIWSRLKLRPHDSQGLVLSVKQRKIRIPVQAILNIYAPVVVLILVSLVLYSVNYKTHQAAKAIVQTPDPSISWDQRFNYFKESIDSFRPLANYPRLILFNQLFDNWEYLSERDATKAIEIVEREARDAIRSEPQSWRIYLKLALLYQKIASTDPSYAGQAEAYLQKASELAPDLVQVLQDSNGQ